MINTDEWRGYNGLVDLGYGHFRVDHSKDEFARGRVHINGIEGFWGLAKVRLAKFKGLPKHTFHLHLNLLGDCSIACQATKPSRRLFNRLSGNEKPSSDTIIAT